MALPPAGHSSGIESPQQMPVHRAEHGAPLDRGRNQDIRVEVRSLNFYDSLLGGAAHG